MSKALCTRPVPVGCLPRAPKGVFWSWDRIARTNRHPASASMVTTSTFLCSLFFEHASRRQNSQNSQHIVGVAAPATDSPWCPSRTALRPRQRSSPSSSSSSSSSSFWRVTPSRHGRWPTQSATRLEKNVGYAGFPVAFQACSSSSNESCRLRPAAWAARGGGYVTQ